MRGAVELGYAPPLPGEERWHYLEPYVAYQGDETFPLSVLIATVVYNDPTFSTYVEAGYGFTLANLRALTNTPLRSIAGVTDRRAAGRHAADADAGRQLH